MVRYFYAFIPVAIVFGLVVAAAIPALALAVLAIGMFFGIPYLVRATIASAHALGHAIARSGPEDETAPALALAFTPRPEQETRDASF